MQGIKQKIKKALPAPVAEWYRIQHRNVKVLRGNYYKHKVKAKKHTGDKWKVVFLVNGAESWNSLKTVYEAAKRDDRCEAYIFVIADRNTEQYEKFRKIEPEVRSIWGGRRPA